MLGIDLTFIKHDLNILSEPHLIKQQGNRFVTEHVDVLIEEVEKLKEVRAITEVLYPSWLFNTVVIKKKLASGESALNSQA